jgi:hypothetical protein
MPKGIVYTPVGIGEALVGEGIGNASSIVAVLVTVTAGGLLHKDVSLIIIHS